MVCLSFRFDAVCYVDKVEVRLADFSTHKLSLKNKAVFWLICYFFLIAKQRICVKCSNKNEFML